MGLGRFELPTPRLSSVCSNQLSYRPLSQIELRSRISYRSFKEPCYRTHRATLAPSKLDRRANYCVQPNRIPCQIDLSKSCAAWSHRSAALHCRDSRKEVIQPQVLLQLPCYDFTPITDHTLGMGLPCGLAPLLLVQPAFVM